MSVLANAVLASQLDREEVFEQGLTDANGTVVCWEPKGCFGFVRWNQMPIEFFLPGSLLPKSDRGRIDAGSQILFDLEPGQADLPKPKAKVSNPRLVTNR